MKRLLVAVDGSPCSDRAIRYLIDQRLPEGGATPPQLLLVNVQRPVSGDVSTFVAHDQIADYHREEGLKALDSARRTLDAAGVAYSFDIAVGAPGEVIARLAEEKGCDEIVMGTHGRTGLTHLLLGSVSSEVIRRSALPVLLIR